ncbi:MAG: occludin [Bacteroides acidifaciens]|uniref:occludin n=1 Tax=Bacteroides acidifaciens TaxID=85831 RepID=UPI0023C06A19|nr:occludin [Bacteroides acidifaciens]MDE6822244.1 occludin [Bacteroides acidifaciens]MDE6986719.1 occludin [Bacteroides acidifaciens]
MKKLILFLSLILSVGFASAQSEIPSDSIRRAPSANIKEFGGFLLDMGLMNVTAPQLPKFDLSMPDMSKDYNQIFRLNTDATYSQGFTDAFSSSYFSGFGYGWGLSSSPQFMQMGSFKLKNGMRINTYGDYDKDGWRVPNRSAMPWEKNNFRGAFELKSANGIGIRIEVQQGHNVPY